MCCESRVVVVLSSSGFYATRSGGAWRHRGIHKSATRCGARRGRRAPSRRARRFLSLRRRAVPWLLLLFSSVSSQLYEWFVFFPGLLTTQCSVKTAPGGVSAGAASLRCSRAKRQPISGDRYPRALYRSDLLGLCQGLLVSYMPLAISGAQRRNISKVHGVLKIPRD